jgi:hypothetical protein
MTERCRRTCTAGSTVRFKSSKLSPSAPASFKSRLASARNLSMSGQNPAIFSSSSLVAASGESGKTVPPTVCTIAILASCGAPCQWVDRQGQGPADPHVVEWLFLVVGCDKVTAIPVVSLHGDLVAQCVDELGREKGISQENLAREAGVTRRSRQTLLFDFDY